MGLWLLARRSRPTFLLVTFSSFFVINFIRQHARLVNNYELRTGDHGMGLLQNSFSMGDNIDSYHVLSEEVAPRIIYSEMRKDQSGWVIFQMLKAHAYAFSKNAIYGGACGESQNKKDVGKVLEAIGWSEILPLRCPGENGAPSGRVYPSTFFEKRHGRRMGAPAWRDEIQRHTDYTYFNQHSESNVDEIFTIVVHIRRRDVTPCCYPGWYLPNSYFASMIDHYVQRAPQNQPIDIRIFSQSESHESWDDLKALLDRRHLKYTLYLDGPVGDVWRAILAADIFIGSISEFSRIPALFARGLVPDPRNITIPIIAEQTKTDNKALLDQCSDTQFVSCKHKWWMKGDSAFQKH